MAGIFSKLAGLFRRRTVRMRIPQAGEVWRRRAEVPPTDVLVPPEAMIFVIDGNMVHFKAPGNYEQVSMSLLLFLGLYEHGKAADPLKVG